MNDQKPEIEFADDYRSPLRFHETYPEVHVSVDALRWELRHRTK